MTQEEKQLLLKDLCARLPYGVMIQHPDLFYPSRMVVEKLASIDREHINDDGMTIEYVKPYLRPMSSMTEEELEELLDEEDIDFDGKGELVRKAMMAYSEGNKLESNSLFSMQYAKAIDWLNAHHFDYRGLIERGLALEAPEEMYK